MKFYSQQGEDKLIFDKYINYRNGFFIELGAMDGVIYSNSLFFENELNWTGVLIEPTNQFNDLVKNRPNCYNFNFAISDKIGEIEFIGNGALGGITETMQDTHRIGWRLDNEYDVIKVKASPISNLISNLDIKRVDIFSIDVEGGELEVLNTFDWNIPVYLILIEGNYTASEIEKSNWINNPNSNGLILDQKYIDRTNKCTEILISNGFEFIENVGCNQIWINKNNSRK